MERRRAQIQEAGMTTMMEKLDMEKVRQLEWNGRPASAGVEPEGRVSWSRMGGPRQLEWNGRAAPAGSVDALESFYLLTGGWLYRRAAEVDPRRIRVADADGVSAVPTLVPSLHHLHPILPSPPPHPVPLNAHHPSPIPPFPDLFHSLLPLLPLLRPSPPSLPSHPLLSRCLTQIREGGTGGR